jgi:hypothetical protein
VDATRLERKDKERRGLNKIKLLILDQRREVMNQFLRSAFSASRCLLQVVVTFALVVIDWRKGGERVTFDEHYEAS